MVFVSLILGMFELAISLNDDVFLMKALQNSVWRAHVNKNPHLVLDAVFGSIYYSQTDSALFSELVKILANSNLDATTAIIFASQLNQIHALEQLLADFSPSAHVLFELAAMAYLQKHNEQVFLMKPMIDTRVWMLFLDFTESESDESIAEFVKLADKNKTKLDSFLNPLLYHCILKNSMDSIDSIFAVQFNPSLKFLFFALGRNTEICDALIDQGLMIGDKLIYSADTIPTRSLLLSTICEGHANLAAYVFWIHPTYWRDQYQPKISEAIVYLLESLKVLDPTYKVSNTELWNAMSAGMDFIVAIFQQHGAETSWMETHANPRYHKVASVIFDEDLINPGNEIISSYAGAPLFLISDTGKFDLNGINPYSIEEGWDQSVSETCTPSVEVENIRITKPRNPAPTAQSSLWDIVLSGKSLKINDGSPTLSWMEPSTSTDQLPMEHVEVKKEDENDQLRALSGMY